MEAIDPRSASRDMVTPTPVMTPITPPNRLVRALSPITPPLRAPLRFGSPSTGRKFKKRLFSLAGFAKSAVAGGRGREELKPLDMHVRGTKKRSSRAVSAMESDEELDGNFDSDDYEDIAATNRDDDEEEPFNNDPTCNADLSDSDMSYSPPAYTPRFPALSRQIAHGIIHPDNVPSADMTTYFHRPLVSEHSIVLYYGCQAPASYWQWPTAQDLTNFANEEAMRREARGKRESAVALLCPPLISQKQTMSGIHVRILKDPEPPHISWQQRAINLVEHARKEALAQQNEWQALQAQRKAHVELIKSGKKETIMRVAAGMVIDENDGFVRVKGTRKRQCAGIDLDLDRVRRKYSWKDGKPPLRGKARAAHDAKVAADLKVKGEVREARRNAGYPVTDAEDEVTPAEHRTPETKAGTKRQTGPRNSTANGGTLNGKAPIKNRKPTASRKEIPAAVRHDFGGENEAERKGDSIIRRSEIKKVAKPRSTGKRGTKKTIAGQANDEPQEPKTPELKSKKQIRRKVPVVTD